ncbi:MAG: 1,4-alpha-glucan branching protein GlgB [Chlamydiae bacterium]|nr:1,4-alpha-glucan branching protein GlgB [Chlamydiota bacterium]
MANQIHEAIIEGLFLEKAHSNPHCLLGLQSTLDHQKIIRIWRPGANKCYLEIFGKVMEATLVHAAGLFEYVVPDETKQEDYRIYHQSGLLAHDPYSFGPTIGELDIHLFAKGVHYKLYDILGAHFTTQSGVSGVRFAVWAPNAKRVAIVGDFNFWNGGVNPMRAIGSSGIWEIFIPGLNEEEKYKFEIHTKEGHLKIKADPFANFFEMRPLNASRVFNLNRFQWTDEKWMQKRAKTNYENSPMTIYEVHLGSWQREGGKFLNYRELAIRLAEYCKEMGFTHIELMPVEEHPLDESWGYQVTGYFAPTSRFGSPSDFQYFVNYLHEREIGIFLDWVPAHFPMDNFSLAQFDGTYLFEHADPRKGYHPHWNTYIFNYGRNEVSNFLIASALFWVEKMHIDGLRVDAVASMVYLDYGRKHGEWIPNIYGGNFNLEAIEFIKHLNSVAHERAPGCLMIAEESTAFDGVTRSIEWGGLGFNLKWNMGWMNDTLQYFTTDPFFRLYHQNLLTFIMIYAFSEKFTLVLSHDEVVHGKGSLLAKMPGDDWQKFANVRLAYGYMICQPGKKLLFMGGEFGEWNEWNCKEELPWHLCQFERHKQLKKCIRDLNHFYLDHPAFWQIDFESRSFEWIDFSDNQNSVISYLRKGESQILICIHHFTSVYLPSYKIYLNHVKMVREIFNTDREEYGGSGKINTQVKILKSEKRAEGFEIQLSPLATLIFEVEFE